MKKISYLSIFLISALFACQKSEPNLNRGNNFPAGLVPDKIPVCHSVGAGFELLQVSPSALESHLAHGDYILDADGDGYTALSACSGSRNDCNDNDASIHPGAPEICGDGKDNNCNGSIDEACQPDFAVFNIRNTNSSIAAPWDTDVVLSENPAGDGFSFGTPRGGQKVGYGTGFFDGVKLKTVESVDWNLISGNTGISPYLNIWVTDGAGNYAIIASENSYPGTDFSTRAEWKVFEYGPSASNLDWLFDSGTGGRDGSQYLTLNNSRITLSQLGDNIKIGPPATYTAPNIGSGAPRGGYGFNLIWGDTQANFAQKNGNIGGLSVTVAGTTHLAAN